MRIKLIRIIITYIFIFSYAISGERIAIATKIIGNAHFVRGNGSKSVIKKGQIFETGDIPSEVIILKAKREGRAVANDEFETACSAACSSGAMVFGDINNEEDSVTPLIKDKRAYGVLDYLQTKPNVIYQVKIKNTNEA